MWRGHGEEPGSPVIRSAQRERESANNAAHLRSLSSLQTPRPSPCNRTTFVFVSAPQALIFLSQ
jgi:hypothetical protein